MITKDQRQTFQHSLAASIADPGDELINHKVNWLLDQARDFTETDFADLALAAADQAGLDLRGQKALRVLLDTIPGGGELGQACSPTDRISTVPVTLAIADALSVGQTLRTLSRTAATPHGTREVFERVGTVMASAALEQLKASTVPR